ncbi:MAG TPA: MFS transporter [Rhodothermales bacterium]|nr:MFS transporter [Rhodothermales bacterium]
MALNINRRLLVSLVIGVLMGAMDLTIVAPALSHIAGSFHVTPSAVILAFSIYAAFYAVSVPLMSKLADVRGYKLIYGISMMIFTIGSAGSALAPTLPVLVAARIVQGIGGGGLFPIAQAIVGAKLPEKQRATALGILMGAFAIGGVLGPNLGGFLVQQLSWHWIFWVNVPLGVFGVVLLYTTDVRDEKHRGEIDWLGAILVAVAFGSLVVSIETIRIVGDVGVFTLRTGLWYVVTVLAFAILVPVERRRKEPILNFALISSPAVVPLLLVSLLMGWALLGSVVFTPLYAQLMFGASAFGSGAVLNAAAFGLGVSSLIAGAYTNRVGAKKLIIFGMVLTSAGLAGMIVLQHSIWGILGGLVFLGAGLGLSQGPLSFLGLSLVPSRSEGQISGLISITRSMGGATGMTLAGVLLNRASAGLSGQIHAQVSGGELSSKIWGSSSSLQALQDAPVSTQQAVRHALGAGLLHGWYMALAAAVIGLAISFALKHEIRRLLRNGQAKAGSVPDEAPAEMGKG